MASKNGYKYGSIRYKMMDCQADSIQGREIARKVGTSESPTLGCRKCDKVHSGKFLVGTHAYGRYGK